MVKMKQHTILQLLLLTLAAVVAEDLVSNNVWHAYKQQHGKSYASLGEERKRREVFQNNVANVLRHNLRRSLGLETYDQGVNQFSDLTWEEFVSTYLRRQPMELSVPTKMSHGISEGDYTKLPDKLDWREAGRVTSVKNQVILTSKVVLLACIEGGEKV